MKLHFVIVLLTLLATVTQAFSTGFSLYLGRIVQPNNSIIYVSLARCNSSNSDRLCCITSDEHETMISNGDKGMYMCQVHNKTFLLAIYEDLPVYDLPPLSLSDYYLSLLQNEALLYFRANYGPVNSINCSFNDQEMQPVPFIQTVESNYSTLMELIVPLNQSESWYNCSVSSNNIVQSSSQLKYVNSLICSVDTYLKANITSKDTAADVTWTTYTYCNRSHTDDEDVFNSQVGFELFHKFSEDPDSYSPTSCMPVSTLTLYSTQAATIFPTVTIFPSTETTSAQESLYAGIGVLAFTNVITLIVLLLSLLCLLNQRKKKRLNISEREQTVQSTSPQTEATSQNIETSPTSNNNTNITTGNDIYSSVEDEVDHHHHHHRPPARVASQYEVPLDLLQQAHVPLPPPPPLYATLDDQHDLTLPNPEDITNTAVTAPNPGYITNITPKANPGYSSTAIKEEGGGGDIGEGETREELDYSYATVNKFLKKPTEDTEYNKLQHD
ncbi:PREDICTED: uncharacterized protein LOC109584477 isoform X2 [Amphimedon queenslandica]|uniref:Ig-like domain-containing protein n=1 Tax=Amphimedon queenslandica TaxID=400682 RepID=A0AAN0JG78_AMPQE|nr:PREDICTED: uncharacterized protein LOC109584477 isoform X2 [Amphimedon queenslandica]|eukprot:XP_019855787.1 PREDICTED: uncharacterized protein LOC109584477 isoform X2 [Amphimedon queenslandica]